MPARVGIATKYFCVSRPETLDLGSERWTPTAIPPKVQPLGVLGFLGFFDTDAHFCAYYQHIDSGSQEESVNMCRERLRAPEP